MQRASQGLIEEVWRAKLEDVIRDSMLKRWEVQPLCGYREERLLIGSRLNLSIQAVPPTLLSNLSGPFRLI
jgi:hypothetical protein